MRIPQLARRLATYLPSRTRRWLDAKEIDLLIRAGADVGYTFRDGELVPVSQLERKYRDALRLLLDKQCRDNVGDYLEFGVYAGASMACMHRATSDCDLRHVRLFGFDSFEGLPTGSDADYAATPFHPGDYAWDEQSTREYLQQSGVDWDRVTLVKGWFDETLTSDFVLRHQIRKASVIMIDCDLYSSAKTALDFCAPLIQDEAVIIFDDWFPDDLGAKDLGEKRAFDEFLSSYPMFSAQELDSYYPKAAKVFLVSRQ